MLNAVTDALKFRPHHQYVCSQLKQHCCESQAQDTSLQLCILCEPLPLSHWQGGEKVTLVLKYLIDSPHTKLQVDARLPH
jgi:hypothetical protein